MFIAWYQRRVNGSVLHFISIPCIPKRLLCEQFLFWFWAGRTCCQYGNVSIFLTNFVWCHLTMNRKNEATWYRIVWIFRTSQRMSQNMHCLCGCFYLYGSMQANLSAASSHSGFCSLQCWLRDHCWPGNQKRSLFLQNTVGLRNETGPHHVILSQKGHLHNNQLIQDVSVSMDMVMNAWPMTYGLETSI